VRHALECARVRPGICLLNIPSWGAGVRPWQMYSGDDTPPPPQSTDDGQIEVFGLYSSFHIAQLQVRKWLHKHAIVIAYRLASTRPTTLAKHTLSPCACAAAMCPCSVTGSHGGRRLQRSLSVLRRHYRVPHCSPRMSAPPASCVAAHTLPLTIRHKLNSHLENRSYDITKGNQIFNV
jgi:hypothetical protein